MALFAPIMKQGVAGDVWVGLARIGRYDGLVPQGSSGDVAVG